MIGRPNVGKSSLVNRFAGAQRVIVADEPGTTRDAIDLALAVDGRPLVVVDTAGMRRQSKVGESVEYYTTLRSQRAAERADVAIVVCDARDGITAQDLRVADLAMHSRLRDARRAQQVGRQGRPLSTSTTSARGSPRSCASARAC